MTAYTPDGLPIVPPGPTNAETSYFSPTGRPTMSDDHSKSYIDSEGEERCQTCDKWLERDYYTIEDHRRVEIRRAERKADDE